MFLQNKTILVSGVGSGLGREIVQLALRDGARVVMGARSESTLEETARGLDPSGERIAWARADITDADDCEALAALAVNRFGGIDAMIQVAAYEAAFGGLYDTDFESWRKAFDTNVIGSLTLTRAVAPLMKEAGGGSIIYIGSLAMWVPHMPQAGYAASKGALLSAMYYLTEELGADRIRCNMVVPSWMWGPPVQAFCRMRAKAANKSEDEIVAEITKDIPLGRIIPDEEVAEVALLLASDRARGITGQTLCVDGGEGMR
jgi:NAD(P)-dependent dehydrogenase (short-subunit alcohol dehydrogenase family)